MDNSRGLELALNGIKDAILQQSTEGWTSWTPTITNLSGGTLNFAKFKIVGKTVHFRIKYTLAGAGLAGTPRFTLPAAANPDYVSGDTIASYATLNDATANVWLASVFLVSATAFDLYYQNSSAVLAAMNAASPFTWASGDRINVAGTYEMA